MASSTARLAKASIRPHVPLIKFRKGGGLGREQVASSAAAVSKSENAPAPSSKPVGCLPRGSGIEEFELPARYGRKPMSTYEGEYIQRGGPE
ncbi:alpha-ketoglutarate dehydrogenase component 4-like isoform X2 [Ornithodoros turicata]|uniref:alpha-ketoglutarate dehydrogenase component 4-like isoform X2 n=1 Tax=Ornithodoros turicata TaxID=34597 RepID=UPI003139E720